MQTILSRQPGRVFRFDDEQTPMTLKLEGFADPFAIRAGRRVLGIGDPLAGRNAALLAVGVQPQANVRFTNTLKKMTYVYTFGESMADLSVSGALFPGACDDEGVPSGLESMLRYYSAYGLAARGRPVRLNVGSLVLDGFLVGGRFDVQDPQTGLGAFTLAMKYLPEDD